MKLGTWLLSLVSPLLGRILVSLGFSIVTITGFTAGIQALRDQVVSGVNSLPADTLNIFLIAGGGVGLGMITGAIATRIMLWQITNATRILGVNPQ